MIVTTEDKKNVFLGVIQKIKKGLGNEENELVITKRKKFSFFKMKNRNKATHFCVGGT